MEIKNLQRELRENDEIAEGLDKRRRIITDRIKNLENSLRQIGPKKLTVSDHAILRYLERHYGVNLAEIRQEIETAMAPFKEMGVTELEAAGFRVLNNTVVTYIGGPSEADARG